MAYVRSRLFAATLAEIGAVHKRIKPRCPWTNCEGVITPVPGPA
jgi:hypothetical protein